MATELEIWKEELRKGVAFKKEFLHSDNWGLYRKYYRGDYSQNLYYNLIFGMARTVIPNVYFRNPYIDVTPTFRPELNWHAKLVESVDNYLLPQLKMKSMIKKCILDTFISGTGPCKLGYDSQFGFDTKQVTEDSQDATKSMFSKRKSKEGQLIEYNTAIQGGMPWAARCAPETVITPYGCTDFDDLEWCAHVVYRPLDDLKQDAKYVVGSLAGTHIELLKDYPIFNTLAKQKVSSPQRDWVELVEIRDFKRGEIKVLVMDHDNWVRPAQMDAIQVTALPFEFLKWNDDPDWAWGVSDVKQIEPQQDEINATRLMMQWHRKLSTLKLLVLKSAIEDEELKKLEQCDDFQAVILLKELPSQSIMELKHQIPADLGAWVEMLRGDVREMQGFSRNQQGEYDSSSRRSATEASIVQMANSIRIDEKRDTCADFVVNIMKKVNQIIFANWSEKTVVQMVGQDGARYWVEYAPSALAGDYTLRIDVESMTPMTRALKKNEILEVINVLSKTPNANMDVLMKLLLKQYDWADAMQLLPQGQQPGQPPVPFDQFTQQQNSMMADPAGMTAARGTNANQMKAALVQRG